MKMIGLLGGVSWESTREYYRMLNEAAREAKGGLHSAPLLLHSFEFAQIVALQQKGDWARLERMLAEAAQGMERSGAQAIAICSNYMHRCAEAVSDAVSVPLLHIADAVGAAIRTDGVQCAGLLGAAGTLEQPFYRERLAAMGIEVRIPNAADREAGNRIIFEELCQGHFTDEARAAYVAMMQRLAEQGAEGMVLGCTEIEQLIGPQDSDFITYPSAELHVKAIAEFMLKE